jgi:uncharacterized protein
VSRQKSLPVVIDTNVWISGLLTKTGAPAQLTREVVRAGQPVFSADTFAELQERLWRPKFDKYISLEQRKALLHDLDAIALWVDLPSSIAGTRYCRDATDDKFIHTALAAEAAWIVTGDQDLLVLFEGVLKLGVRIISPADALALPDFAANSKRS